MIGTMWMFQHGPIFKDPSPAQDFYGAKGEPRDGEGSHSLFQQLGSLSSPVLWGTFARLKLYGKERPESFHISLHLVSRHIYILYYIILYII